MDHLLETKWGEGSKRNNAKMKEVIDIGLIDLPDNKGNTCLHAAVKRWTFLFGIKIIGFVTCIFIRCLTQESARGIIEKLVRPNKQATQTNWERFQVERGAKLSIKNNEQKTPLDLMFVCIQSPGDFISSLWSKRVRSNLDFDWSLMKVLLKNTYQQWKPFIQSHPSQPQHLCNFKST